MPSDGTERAAPHTGPQSSACTDCAALSDGAPPSDDWVPSGCINPQRPTSVALHRKGHCSAKAGVSTTRQRCKHRCLRACATRHRCWRRSAQAAYEHVQDKHRCLRTCAGQAPSVTPRRRSACRLSSETVQSSSAFARQPAWLGFWTARIARRRCRGAESVAAFACTISLDAESEYLTAAS